MKWYESKADQKYNSGDIFVFHFTQMKSNTGWKFQEDYVIIIITWALQVIISQSIFSPGQSL